MTDKPLNHVTALEDLLRPLGLSTADSGGTLTITGRDPIAPDNVPLAAAIALPQAANAIAAAAFLRTRGGAGQDVSIDLRQAVHHVTPHAFFHPTLAGDLPCHALVPDNPFLLDPYVTADGRVVMASGVYPHLAAKWCRFLDVPPSKERVAEAFAQWNAFELEEAANAAGLPLCVARTPEEWAAHPQGALLAQTPVVTLRRIGDAAPREHGPAARAFHGIRVLSFTHAIAGPTVGRTLSEHGADVLNATRNNDYEHDFIYVQANIGSRSTYVDLSTEAGRERGESLLKDAHIVVNNHRGSKLEKLGLAPERLAADHPGIITVAITCYGSEGPWKDRGGFDMNGSAASGLMYANERDGLPRLPVTGMINDFTTGYLGALGAAAALRKQATEGGSWAVEVNLTRSAMWFQELGLVDKALAGTDDEHQMRAPEVFESPTLLGDLRFPAPPAQLSQTPSRWPDPVLVPRGSSRPEWL